ncbi:MAG: hypothetical protein AABY86_07060, partial [Bdellovibrionota bacterium]
MMILKYFTLVFFCLGSYAVYPRTKRNEVKDVKAGDEKTPAQLKKTCSHGNPTLKRQDFSSRKSYRDYVDLCTQDKPSPAQSQHPQIKKTQQSTMVLSPQQAPANASSGRPTTISTQLPSRPTSFTTSPATQRSTTTIPANTNPALAIRSTRVSISNGNEKEKPKLNMHVLNNNNLIRQGQPANSIPDDRARAGTRSEIVSACPEQFAGPANNFHETCCQPTYNTLEANYLQALTQNVQTPVETEHVKTAFLTLNVMGEDQAKRLLRSIADNFEEFAQRDLKIARIE